MTDKPISIGRHQSQINRVCRRHRTLAACRRLDNLARILSRWSAAPSCWWWWWWCCGGNTAGDTSEMQSRMWRGWSGLSESTAVGRSVGHSWSHREMRNERTPRTFHLTRGPLSARPRPRSRPPPPWSDSDRPASQPAGFHHARRRRRAVPRGTRRPRCRRKIVTATTSRDRRRGGGVAERAAARLLIQPRNNCTASASPCPHRLAYHRTPL